MTRWTLVDVPPEVQEGYVLLGASLMPEGFMAAPNPAWATVGLRMVQAFVHVPISGPRAVENY